MIKKNSPIAFNLFAGAGGCSLGFQKAGYEIVYAIELEPAAVQTYQANFSQTICQQADIRDFDFNKLLYHTQTQPGELDILIGGPPCQGFSTAGRRFLDDPRNVLLRNYLEALTILRPKWFLLENVEGLLTSKCGQDIYEIAQAIIELGYWIRIDKIHAHEYGLWQRRKLANAIPPLLAQLLATHIKTNYGFNAPILRSPGKLLGFTLTKAITMSPALNQTQALLRQLLDSQTGKQLNLF